MQGSLTDYFRPYNQHLESCLGMKFNGDGCEFNDDPEATQKTFFREIKLNQSTERIQKIKIELERSRSWLSKIHSNLDEEQNSTERPPNLAFITCIEPGILEKKSLLLYESIRRYGGGFSQCPIYALSPRSNFKITKSTQKRLESLSVIYIDKNLNLDLDFFAVANKSYAAAYIEDNTSHEILVWVDSDSLFFREPSKFMLPDAIDVAVRPINRRKTCTSGCQDEFEDFWRKLCQLCHVDFDRIPFVETIVDRSIIKACYNGGLVVVRSSQGIFRKWIENLKIGVQEGFDPRLHKQWDNDQPLLSMAIWGSTERVQILEPVYNYNVQGIDIQPQQARVYSSRVLVHIHYHHMLETPKLDKNPLLQSNFDMEEEFKSWLLPKLPIDKNNVKEDR